MIYDRQNDYYKALRASDRTGDTAAFVEFTLGALLVALKDTLSHVKPRRETSDDRLQLAQSSFGARSFSRKDYLKLHVGISTATGSRDLKRAVSEGALIMSGDKALARYQFKNTAISRV